MTIHGSLGLLVWATSLFVPGAILLRTLGGRFSWILATALSLVCIYFAGLFTTLVLQRFSMATMASCLVVLSLIFAAVSRFSPRPPDTDTPADNTRRVIPAWLGIATAVAAAVFVWKVWAHPLSGADTAFRWHLLPQLIVQTGHLDYYPPVNRADYALYFFPDRIAPWVAIHYAWFYSCLGVVEPRALVAPLVVVAAVIVAAAAKAVPSGSPGAPLLVSLLILASPWLFWGVVIGQETGWIIVGLATTAYAWSRMRGDQRWISALPPAIAIQAAVQSREYGPAFIGVGLLLGLVHSASRRQLLIFAVVSAAFVVPWHLHLLARGVLTAPFLGIGATSPSESLISGYFAYVHGKFALWHHTPKELLSIVWFLCKGAIPLLIGATVVICLRRHRPFHASVWLAGVALTLGLWALSVGYTSGGHIYAARVACPLWLLLALLCHHLGDRALLDWARHPLRQCLLVLMVAGASAFGAGAPLTPWKVGWSPWARHAFGIRPAIPLVDPVALKTTPSQNVLTDNAYAHVDALTTNAHLRCIPPWTPELDWLHDGKPLSAPDVTRRLTELGILNTGQLRASTDAAFWARFPLLHSSSSAQ